MMKTITLREAYDWLQIEESQPTGLTHIEWEHLVQFLEEKYNNESLVEIGIRKLRFINLVGVIQLKTVRIEILPKLDLHQDGTALNRRALLNMLSMTKQLPVQLNDRTLSQFEKVDLTSVLVHLYISELYKSLKKGLFRGYYTKTENSNHLKGRLLVSQHIRKNTLASIKAFCEYDELSANVPLNQILRAAMKIIFPFVKQSHLKTQSLMILEMFDEVDDVFITKATIDNIQINRQNQHFEAVMRLAIAILQSTSMSTGVNNQIAFSFLFKMNDLYEGYVGECLKRVMAPTSCRLDLQHKEKRLLVNVHSGRENISLKPDFVISRIEHGKPIPTVILDTKWKNILVNSHLNYNQVDIYQMYAYVTAYKTAKRCILLYPRISEEALFPKWAVPDSVPVKHIEVHTIRLDHTQHTIEDLGELVVS